MKTLSKFIILLLIVLSGCDEGNVNYSCVEGNIRILNKESTPCARGSGDCEFKFYLYDGRSAYWCSTDKSTWNKYNVNDTLPTMVITKTVVVSEGHQ